MEKISRKKIDDLKAGVLNRATETLESWTGRNWVRSEKVLPQEEKISNALFALLKTEVSDGSPLALYKSALRFIVFGWNSSFLDIDARSKALQKFAEDIQQRGADEATRRAIISHMVKVIAKKHALFPHDKRFVVSCDVWLEGDLIRVTAAAIELAA